MQLTNSPVSLKSNSCTIMLPTANTIHASQHASINTQAQACSLIQATHAHISTNMQATKHVHENQSTSNTSSRLATNPCSSSPASSTRRFSTLSQHTSANYSPQQSMRIGRWNMLKMPLLKQVTTHASCSKTKNHKQSLKTCIQIHMR